MRLLDSEDFEALTQRQLPCPCRFVPFLFVLFIVANRLLSFLGRASLAESVAVERSRMGFPFIRSFFRRSLCSALPLITLVSSFQVQSIYSKLTDPIQVHL